MKKLKNVVSLFDGKSGGQIALEIEGFEVENYFASEVDKYAMTVSRANYPKTKYLGSVTNINYIDGYLSARLLSDSNCSFKKNEIEIINNFVLCSKSLNENLTKESTNESVIYEVGEIDLLIGGSPCQNFSFAGSRKGMVTKDNVEILTLDQYLELKANGFEFQGQSFLFWEYVRMLKECKPKYFLLENVKMSKKWQDLISSILGVEPILINSALVSAQNRQRLYWTNIPNIEQPEDRGILLKDIMEQEILPTPSNLKELLKLGIIKSAQNLTGESQSLDRALKNNKLGNDKANCLAAVNYKGMTSNGMTNVLVNQIGQGHNGKTNCLTTVQNDNVAVIDTDNLVYRKLTPLECERLQTVPDNYTNHVSNAQRYKMLGNGWTVDVIAHIFKNIK